MGTCFRNTNMLLQCAARHIRACFSGAVNASRGGSRDGCRTKSEAADEMKMLAQRDKNIVLYIYVYVFICLHIYIYIYVCISDTSHLCILYIRRWMSNILTSTLRTPFTNTSTHTVAGAAHRLDAVSATWRNQKRLRQKRRLRQQRRLRNQRGCGTKRHWRSEWP